MSRDQLRRKLSSAVSKIIRQLDADGIVLPADLLAYKTFRKRESLEAKLIRKVGIVHRAQLGNIMELLGDPPNLDNLTDAFWDNAGVESIAAIQPLLIEAQIEQAREILDDNPAIGVDWAIVNQEAVDWARKYTFDLVKGIDATSQELLQSSVSSYFEQQMTIGQLEGMLTSTFGPVRSEMIASTEITRAASQGEQGVLNQLHEQGIEMEATWETNDDEQVCDICGPLDGINADEFDDDGQPQWGDLGPPPAHPRCRCWFSIGFAEKKALKYSEGQPRDEAGRWTSDGGGGTGAGEGNGGAGNIGDNNGKPYGDKFNNGKPYYRSTPTDDPMSDWGHAMMADNDGVVDQFGTHNWIFDPSGATSGVVNIEDLDSQITTAWNNTRERGYYDTNGADISYEMDSFGADEIRASFNPSDIVNGAEGYDTDLAIWLYAEVLEPNNIGAVITNDGAVVYDPQMLKQIK